MTLPTELASIIIKTKNLSLIPLLSNEDYKELLSLKIVNLKNDYIKTLFSKDPKEVDEEYIEFSTARKMQRNELYKEDKEVEQALFVIKKENKVIGCLEYFGNPVEFGIFIDQKNCGNGYGFEAIMAIIEFFKKQNIREYKWECYADVVASNKLAKKCGFVLKKEFFVEKRKANEYSLNL